MSKSKQKQAPEEQNGRVQAESIDLETAQYIVQAARRRERERFVVELDRLCKEYGFALVPEPYFDDGRTRARIAINDAQRGQ